MLIQQALFGEENGGHALLSSSVDNASVLANLLWRTDLPGTAPGGLLWKPFLSGFPLGQYYVLQRTFSDASAARGGMVLTHALLLPIAEADKLSDLRGLSAMLMECPDRSVALTSIPFEVAEIPSQDTSKLPDGTPFLATALVTAAKLPVVWVGQKGFEDAVFALWFHLWPAMRRNFSFRLSFSPQDCYDHPPTVVTTPDDLRSRWSGYSLVNPIAQESDCSAARLLLEPSVSNPVRAFADEIGAQVNSVQDLDLVESCRSYSVLNDPRSNETMALVRLLVRLSPIPERGAQIKARALQQLAGLVRGMNSIEVGSLRNMDLSGFLQAESVWEQVAAWMEKHAISDQPSNGSLTRCLNLALSGESKWSRALLDGLDRAAHRNEEHLARNVWKWWLADPSLVDGLFPRLSTNAGTEVALLRTCPENIADPVAAGVIRHSAVRRWFKLHGLIVGRVYDFRRALDLQLHLDKDPGFLDGLSLAVQSASGEDLISAAIALKESRLMVISAERIAQSPSLCASFDAQEPTWVELLVTASQKNSEVWKALPQGRLTLYDILDKILTDAKSTNMALLSYLATTPLADITLYSRRSEIWPKLPKEVYPSLLSATAEGWRREYCRNADYDPNIENILLTAVLDEPEVSRFLRERIPHQLATALGFFLRFASLSEIQFDQWLVATLQAVPKLDAQNARSIGQLILKRGWRSVAMRVSRDSRTYTRYDLQPAVRECKQLLPIAERLLLYVTGSLEPSQMDIGELWEAVLVTASELYPNGPREGKIWSRAGGAESALPVDGTGLSQWREAIRLLRLGGGEGVDGASLLRQMRRDFPGNRQLKWLVGQPEFGRQANERARHGR
jgi:GTPase-associated protein 1/effector-associated domain 1 (EAD1)-containing protein